MERMVVYFVRLLERSPDIIVNMVIYLALLVVSVYTTVHLMSIPPILKFISAFDSIFIIFIICAITFLIFASCCSGYRYIRFIKYPPKTLLRVGFIIGSICATLYALKQLDGYEVGSSLSELFEYIYFSLFVIFLALLLFGFLIFSSLLLERIYGHKINTHFKFACSAIKRLEQSQNSEMGTYKDLHTVHRVSAEYTHGIREIKNLLIRGINPNGFFDSNTELNLNEILDLLTFSMQYYLFCGGPEQVEAVKNHLERMAINFDEEYNINTDQFMHEILRMCNEIHIYFKKNNIYIARSNKLADRIRSHLPQVLLAIVLLVISIITKDFIIN